MPTTTIDDHPIHVNDEGFMTDEHWRAIDFVRSSELPSERWIRVRGTAFGAEGHTVKIFEAACGRRSNDPECFDSLPVRWAKVHTDGTFTTVYPARRFLPGGTDCVDGSFETFACQMTVTVLDRLGRRDDSFGVSGRGVPAANLTFRLP